MAKARKKRSSARRSTSRKSTSKRSTTRKSSSCVKPSDCGLVVARVDFKSAQSCSTKNAAVGRFKAVAAKRMRSLKKPDKLKLFKEALRMEMRAALACGEEAKAARIQAALAKRDKSDSRMFDESYTGGFEGWRRRASKGLRGRRRARRKRSW